MRNPITQQRARRLRNQTTDAERHLWRHLRSRQLGGYRFRRQVPIGRYVADFACLEKKLVLELDGGQHQDRRPQDARRDREIELEGYRVLRFWDHDVLRNTEGVLIEILRALEAPPPPS